MHLHPEDCANYYCSQVGNGSYFQGLPFQRGYGFFGDLRRYITPIAIRAGKYLGKQLLQTGSNVVQDVAGGQSFKDSARARLRETSKKVKSDFFKTLQKGGAIKRKRQPKNSHSARVKHRKTTKRKDIFT